MTKTIVAISTPIGVGGISIVRLSGENALSIASKFFSFPKNIEPRKLYLNNFKGLDFTEKCLAVYFKAPFSYTGEDLVEFQCHGGYLLTQKILATLLNGGAFLADGGEFTKRAFINGKMSLDEAEGVIEIINGESESQIKAGYDLMIGGLKTEINKLQSKLTDMLAKIEVALDYPDEDLEDETKQNIDQELNEIKQKLNELYSTSSTGNIIKNGSKILILGKANVGKSSLMNAMLNYDRAIVTDIKGTTRDTLEESFLFKGIKFTLIDTAGLRDTKDIVEKIGVDRAKQAINIADVILFVVDGTESLCTEDKEIIKLINNKKVICVINKTDKNEVIKVEDIPFDNVIKISAINKKGIVELKDKIYNLIIDSNIINDGLILTNIRHIDAIKRAIENTNYVLNNLNSIELDLLTIDIKNIWLALGEITGENSNEEIINAIFTKFCVGK